MKIIFLDFDGVLHPENPAPNQLFSNAYMLDNFLRDYQCQVIVTSSWQFSPKYQSFLNILPGFLAKSITGETQCSFKGNASRLKEINHYLHMKHLSNIDWVAIDDKSEKFPDNFSQLILCDSLTGITEKQISILKNWFDH